MVPLHIPGGSMPIRTAHIKKYIQHNFRRIHNIADIARIFNVSGETLRRSFRRTEGIPLSRYVTKTKLMCVQRKLRQTDKSCFEILYEAGFSREDSGARSFRRLTGLTMMEYRNLHNKKQKGSAI
jgi:two-component system response regulator YesN